MITKTGKRKRRNLPIAIDTALHYTGDMQITQTFSPPDRAAWREWLDAAVFAIVAATIIRTFFVEAYTIPSESMEGTMLVNDYLFVSKISVSTE